MDKPIWDDDLVPYVLGDLSDSEREAFEAGGTDSAELDAARGTIETLRTLPEVTLAQDLTAAILAETKRAQEPIAFPASSWLKIAAVLLLVLGVTALVTQIQAPTPVAVADARQEAVDRSLQWLLESQDSSGAWDPIAWNGRPQYQVGLTGLALLSLLQGEADADEAIDKSVRFLVGQQTPEGNIGPVFREGQYNHSMATLALLEAYRAKPTPPLKKVLDRAVAFCANKRPHHTEWRYDAQDAAPTDEMSLWPLLALKRAGALGWDQARDVSDQGLARLADAIKENRPVALASATTGGFSSLTAMGLLQANSTQPESGLEAAYLERCASRLERDPAPADFYQAYFMANGLAAVHEGHSDLLLKDVLAEILGAQTQSGKEAGSWELSDRWSRVGGRIYTTSMATMTLLVEPAPSS